MRPSPLFSKASQRQKAVRVMMAARREEEGGFSVHTQEMHPENLRVEVKAADQN